MPRSVVASRRKGRIRIAGGTVIGGIAAKGIEPAAQIEGRIHGANQSLSRRDRALRARECIAGSGDAVASGIAVVADKLGDIGKAVAARPGESPAV